MTKTSNTPPTRNRRGSGATDSKASAAERKAAYVTQEAGEITKPIPAAV